MIFYNKTYMIHYDSMIIMIPLYLRWIIYLLLFFIMFRTVFFAVLAALLVYNFLSNSNNDQRSGIFMLIIGIVIICWIWFLIMLLIWLIIANWDTIKEIWLYIVYWIIGLIINCCLFLWVSYSHEYLKFKLRKKEWIIKSKEKFSYWKYDDKWIDSLSEKDKEKEDKINKRISRMWFRALISIPLLIIIGVLWIFLIWIIKTYL